MKRQRLIDLIIRLAIWVALLAPAHEFFHYQVGTWLGGYGFKVTYPSFISGLCSWEGGVEQRWIVYLAGGLLTGAIMWLLAWRSIKTPTLWDEDEVFVLAILGTMQIAYGIGEISLGYEASRPYFHYIVSVLCVAAVIPVLIWRVPHLARYFDETL